MKKVSLIILSLIIFITLTACPSTAITKYKFIGDNSNNIINGKEKLDVINQKIKSIEAELLVNFSDKKHPRIASVILFNELVDDNFIKEINSSRYGKFSQFKHMNNLSDSLKTYTIYNLPRIGKIKKDTVTIHFINDIEFYYVSK
ncbi:hypothetical protein HXZ94_01010 [Empedobacter falsenii]|uniref:hypothetical protein n=1 Tax=Empedobacter falsenii TaxID=343874 RepID=UPI002578FBFC|nr:hypothetical protein [Empedobacter falsenii]MDM1297086.1 hypothetical protein [Empedobacter falsenii]MDM1316879.1 hypothetical protein [Empedobacter falsenii]